MRESTCAPRQPFRRILLRKGVLGMKKPLKLTLIGGDLRQAYLCESLLQDGHEVSVFGLDRQSFPREIHVCKQLEDIQADVVIFPMPLQNGENLQAPLSNSVYKLKTVVEALPAGLLAVGGAILPASMEIFKTCHLDIVDYLKREELAVLNAIPTSEGALQLAMEELPITLHGARCLVTGNGRIGTILSNRLKALGAQVTVTARKQSDFAWIASEGMDWKPTAELETYIGSYDLIINTVPDLLFHRGVLAQMKPDSLLIDLASKPGGVDFSAAQELGRKVIWALSLPGKVAPKTAAYAIKQTVYNILEERGILDG